MHSIRLIKQWKHF